MSVLKHTLTHTQTHTHTHTHTSRASLLSESHTHTTLNCSHSGLAQTNFTPGFYIDILQSLISWMMNNYWLLHQSRRWTTDSLIVVPWTTQCPCCGCKKCVCHLIRQEKCWHEGCITLFGRDGTWRPVSTLQRDIIGVELLFLVLKSIKI